MAYQVQCQKCRTDTWAGNIVDLIDAHTDDCGRLICGGCGATESYVHRITGLWEKEPGEEWDGYIKGVIRITTDSSRYSPYVFLTARSAAGEVSGIHFSYYKDPGPNGRLTDGPGPGGAPVLAREELFQFLERLGAVGVIKPKDLEVLASRIRRESTEYLTALLGSASRR